MNEQISQAVKQFAKQNKVSHAKLMEFVNSLPRVERKSSVGKPVSDASKEIRQKLADMRTARQGQSFTVAQLATELKADPVIVNNNIRFLQKQENMFKQSGTVEKEKGQRGRKALLWTFN